MKYAGRDLIDPVKNDPVKNDPVNNSVPRKDWVTTSRD